jgi:hypothetical protein
MDEDYDRACRERDEAQAEVKRLERRLLTCAEMREAHRNGVERLEAENKRLRELLANARCFVAQPSPLSREIDEALAAEEEPDVD